MDLNKRIFFVCLAVAGLAQAAGLGLSQQPLLAVASLLPALGMLFARKPKYAGWAHLSLTGFAALSAVGLVVKAPVLPIVLATGAALAAWDLLLETHLPAISPSVTSVASVTSVNGNWDHARLHLKSLGLAVAVGLAGAIAGTWIHWRAPFLVTLVLAVLALYCLDWALRHGTR